MSRTDWRKALRFLANRPRNFTAKIDAGPAPVWNLPHIGALPFDWRINGVRLRYRLAPVRQPITSTISLKGALPNE
jgi:hypothetical protein